MKVRFSLVLFVVLSSMTVNNFGQELTLTTTAANTVSSKSSIDLPGLTNNPLAIIVATPTGNTELLNTNPIGAWYYSGKWNIFNSNHSVMPLGATYMIQFVLQPGPNQFTHLVTKENLGAEGSYIDNPALNNKPGAQFKILQNYAPEVRSPYNLNRFKSKADYSTAAGRWYIANVNGEPLAPNTVFNIIINNGGTNPAPTPGPTPASTPSRLPVVTPTPLPVYSPSPIPISRDTPRPVLDPTPIPRITPVPLPVSTPRTPPTPTPVPAATPIRLPDATTRPTPDRGWILRDDLQPTIAPNAEILLFIHGMDSRAEEADDITKALFALVATGYQPPSAPPVSTPSSNPQMAAVLKQLLEKYKGCILEKYETQADMASRGLAPNLSGLSHTGGLQDRDTVACVSGNCSRASRLASYNSLLGQANRGDATNFQTNLQRAIPRDCFYCAKHKENHTKHVHCTMEAGGNRGLQSAFFEGCKAGVDLQALTNSIISEISGVISNLTGIVPLVPTTGGPSVATNYALVPFAAVEPCDNRDTVSAGGQKIAVLPADYYAPAIPPNLLDMPPQSNFNIPAGRNIGKNEGRLNPELRAAAAGTVPLESLRLAAYQFATGNTDMGKAFADLSVTGHRAFGDFNTARPKEPFCQSLSGQRPANLIETDVLNGCHTALDRAYKVANFLRTGQRGDTPTEKARKSKERLELGWIAVSGEDDSPHRPVNVPSSDFPQYDIDVEVPAPLAAGSKTVTVRTRYWIAQSQTANPGGSGKNLVVISLDLPTSGYTTNLPYDLISPLDEIGKPKWTPIVLPIIIPNELLYMVAGVPPLPSGPITNFPDFEATGKTPLLDFIENHIVRFTETLDQKIPIKSRIKVVMGGSLGGNMSFRLGRRPNVPWLPKVIVWSPASIWTSLGEGNDLLKHLAPRKGWEGANQATKSPGEGDRAEFFGSWDRPILPVIIDMAQSDTWTSDYYACKKSSVAAARLDRHETYDARFLAWHWRLGAEQLLYSHQSIDPATNRPWYMSNQKPMLLACGTEDHVKFNDICPATMRTAPLMTMTPGKAIFLEKTGHSLDNERRNYFARQIVDFLGL